VDPTIRRRSSAGRSGRVDAIGTSTGSEEVVIGQIVGGGSSVGHNPLCTAVDVRTSSGPQ
jgi:hypothetical protein